ncbi:hypothetical protein BSKO_03026 [Bryopsis sp. KO-2023]|nr:hypothetical protein BSKO_03026 [Bryopsis sp. KO-2023]
MTALNTDPKDWLSAEELEYLKDHVVTTDAQLLTLRWQIFTLMDINSRFQFNFAPAAAANEKKQTQGNPVLPYADRALRSSIDSFARGPTDPMSDAPSEGMSQVRSPLKLPYYPQMTPASNQRKTTQTKASPPTAARKRSRKRPAQESEDVRLEEEFEENMSGAETSEIEEVPVKRRTSSRRRRGPSYAMADLLADDSPLRPKASPARSPKPPSASRVKLKEMVPVTYEWPEDPCGVCGCAHWDDENMIIMCDGKDCNFLVHIGCHGLMTVPQQDPWFCDICAAKLNPQASNCVLCPVSGGVLKKVSKVGNCVAPTASKDPLFVHTCCALWHPYVSFQDPSRVMDVDLTGLKYAKVDALCCICKQGNGAIQCSYRQCRNTFHVLCGRSKKFKGCVREDGNTIMLCERHSFENKFAEGRLKLLGSDSEAVVAAVDEGGGARTEGEKVRQANIERENSPADTLGKKAVLKREEEEG